MSVDSEANDQPRLPGISLDREIAELRDRVTWLGSENARLLRLLELSPVQARPPGPAQTGIFDGQPGMVDVTSSPEAKIAFFASLFAARTDVHAVRWENARTGRLGWMPAVRGGWRKGMAASSREYLPLTSDIIVRCVGILNGMTAKYATLQNCVSAAQRGILTSREVSGGGLAHQGHTPSSSGSRPERCVRRALSSAKVPSRRVRRLSGQWDGCGP